VNAWWRSGRKSGATSRSRGRAVKGPSGWPGCTSRFDIRAEPKIRGPGSGRAARSRAPAQAGGNTD